MRDIFEYTAKGTVGMMVPMESTTVEPELSLLLGPDVAMLSMKITNGRIGTPFERMAENIRTVPDHVTQFGTAPIDVFGFALTASSYLVEDHEAPETVDFNGKPVQVVLAASAVKAALRAVNAKKIALVSPYWAELTQAGVNHYNARGFEVGQIASIGPAKKGHMIYGLRGEEILAGISAIDKSKVDAIVVTGTGAPSLSALAVAQMAGGLPIVSSNFATGWMLASKLAGTALPIADWMAQDAPWKKALATRYPQALADVRAA